MIQKMEEPTSDSMFYSPTFKRYESVTFYANLLSVLKQYTQIIDQCPSTIRKLVWSHIFQLLGQPQRPCDQMFTPVINSWLNEKSVDLMDIETYFAAFTQAQVENPSIFPALPNISSQYSIPGISAPTTSVRVSKSHLSSMMNTLSPSHNNNNNRQSQTPTQTPIGSPKSPLKQQQQQQQYQQQSPIQSFNNGPSQLPSNPQNQPTVWSTELSSVFSQLALLQSWSHSLDRLSPYSRDNIWRTCRYIPQFINYDKTSFAKTVHKWTVDPIPNLSHITVMFAAIGYLKEMGAIRGDFNYSNASSPVFASPMNNHSETTPPMSPSSYDLSSDNTPDYSVSPPSSPRPGQRSSNSSNLPSPTSLSTPSGTPFKPANIHQLPIFSMSNYSSPVHTPSSTPQYLSPRPLSDVPISPKQHLQLPSLNDIHNLNSLKKRKSIDELLQQPSVSNEHQKMISNLMRLEQRQKQMSVSIDEDDETDQEFQELKKMSEETIIKVNSYSNVSPLKKQRSSSDLNNHNPSTSPSSSSSNPSESRSSINSILCS